VKIKFCKILSDRIAQFYNHNISQSENVKNFILLHKFSYISDWAKETNCIRTCKEKCLQLQIIISRAFSHFVFKIETRFKSLSFSQLYKRSFMFLKDEKECIYSILTLPSHTSHCRILQAHILTFYHYSSLNEKYFTPIHSKQTSENAVSRPLHT
jgi:hypothetical protein